MLDPGAFILILTCLQTQANCAVYSEEEQLYVFYKAQTTRAAARTDQDEQYQELYCRSREGGRGSASLIRVLVLIYNAKRPTCSYLDETYQPVTSGNRDFSRSHLAMWRVSFSVDIYNSKVTVALQLLDIYLV